MVDNGGLRLMTYMGLKKKVLSHKYFDDTIKEENLIKCNHDGLSPQKNLIGGSSSS